MSIDDEIDRDTNDCCLKKIGSRQQHQSLVVLGFVSKMDCISDENTEHDDVESDDGQKLQGRNWYTNKPFGAGSRYERSSHSD